MIRFWLEAGEERWFRKDAVFDAAIRERFGAWCVAARTGGLDDWEETPEGALALLLLLDQFPRNLHRGTAQAFAADARSRAVAGAAIARGFDLRVDPALRAFVYMPFMHSENAGDQNRCVSLCAAHAPANLPYAREHRDIVLRFGRFPHRNEALGRRSTPAEQAYLAGGGFGG